MSEKEKEVRESLESLKQISLQALNTLVRKIVEEEKNGKQSPTEPSSSGANIVLKDELTKSWGDLKSSGKKPANNENIHVGNSSTSPKGSKSSLNNQPLDPQVDAIMNMSNSLSTSFNHTTTTTASSNHQLALALAALCNGLYTILEEGVEAAVGSSGTPENTANVRITTENVGKAQVILSQLTQVQTFRPATASNEDGEQTLWEEMDRLMSAIHAICEKRTTGQGSPKSTTFSTTSTEATAVSGVKLPTYQQAIKDMSNADPEVELITLVAAIERVYKLTPRLTKQDVILTPQKEQMLSALHVYGLVERLLRHTNSYNSQRVDMKDSKYGKLNLLVENITQSHKRSLVNQRAELSSSNQNKMELGKLNNVIDRQAKQRLTNQDWVSPEQRLVEDLQKLQGELFNSSPSNIQMNRQRFQMTDEKEKKMYLGSLSTKIDKLEARRLGNQESMSFQEIKEKKFEEIDKILGKISPSMNDQRATTRRTSHA